MKKVVLLSGSPRPNGNSSMLCDEFIRGAAEAGNKAEKILLSRKKVVGCMGCNACYRNGGICVQKDDMEEIKNKLLEADVIVLASPVYFYSMTAQLKAVIDRTYSFYQELAGKEFYFIVTCAGPGMEYTETILAALRGFTCCVPDAKERGILCATGVMEAGEVKAIPEFKQAYEMGKNL